jgi:hypothetical protein
MGFLLLGIPRFSLEALLCDAFYEMEAAFLKKSKID